MTNKSNWCGFCTHGQHDRCHGRFFRGGKKVRCQCSHNRIAASAGDRAREFQAMRLRRLAQMEADRVNRKVEIQAAIGLPAWALQNNRKVIKLSPEEKARP